MLALENLAKHLASAIQIPGDEGALFCALEMKHDPPKYRLIYHDSLVGQAPSKLKGKVCGLPLSCKLTPRDWVGVWVIIATVRPATLCVTDQDKDVAVRAAASR